MQTRALDRRDDVFRMCVCVCVCRICRQAARSLLSEFLGTRRHRLPYFRAHPRRLEWTATGRPVGRSGHLAGVRSDDQTMPPDTRLCGAARRLNDFDCAIKLPFARAVHRWVHAVHTSHVRRRCLGLLGRGS